jgi:hypothetical protein
MYHHLRYRYRYNFLVSSAAANEIEMALEEAELVCAASQIPVQL